jgi:hypothetical protein
MYKKYIHNDYFAEFLCKVYESSICQRGINLFVVNTMITCISFKW